MAESSYERMLEAQRALEARREREGVHPAPRWQPPRKAAESLEEVLVGAAERGVVPWVSDAEIARYEADRERRLRRERLRFGGVDDVLTERAAEAVTDGTLDATEALDIVRRWVAYQRGDRAKGSRPVLALVGAMGRGKTVAAAWLIAQEGGRYVHAEHLCRLHAARFGAEAEECARILRTGVLVVDELGTEEDARRASAVLYDVVDRRQGARLTLLLGNLTKRRPKGADGKPNADAPAGLAERYDVRTLDRLREVGSVVEIEGESLRRGSL